MKCHGCGCYLYRLGRGRDEQLRGKNVTGASCDLHVVKLGRRKAPKADSGGIWAHRQIRKVKLARTSGRGVIRREGRCLYGGRTCVGDGGAGLISDAAE